MKLIHCIITFNRMKFLKQHLETWDNTRDKSHDWTLLVADDGSDSDVLDYIRQLSFDNVAMKVFFNNRRGVHYQVNQCLKVCSERDFDLGFMAEDDTYFIQSGWDNLYIKAVQSSGYDFLCYFNKKWAVTHGKKVHPKKEEDCIYDKLKGLQSEVIAYLSEGQFWTFTKRIIEKVGYFDAINFGVFGSAHTDFALRCSRSGFNVPASCFDIYKSQEYIQIQDDYKVAFHGRQKIDPGAIGVPNPGYKGQILNKTNRRYIAYNECVLDMNGEKI